MNAGLVALMQVSTSSSNEEDSTDTPNLKVLAGCQAFSALLEVLATSQEFLISELQGADKEVFKTSESWFLGVILLFRPQIIFSSFTCLLAFYQCFLQLQLLQIALWYALW